jgi:hypothetical protein
MSWTVIWLLCAIMVGVHAGKKGHNPVVAFLLAVLLSPLVGMLIVMLRQPATAQSERELLQEGEHKKCSACAELIRQEALRCRYCGEEFAAASCQPPAPHAGRGGYKVGYALGRLFKTR